MNTEQRLTTEELAVRHRKSMDEAQRLEPSVMVTERNWSAMLKMQTSAEKFEKQAGSLNERYSSGCKALTENTKLALTEVLNDTKKQLSDTVQEARKKIRTCAWISITAVILCATLCALAVLWSS